jgi:hypothetical protein
MPVSVAPLNGQSTKNGTFDEKRVMPNCSQTSLFLSFTVNFQVAYAIYKTGSFISETK